MRTVIFLVWLIFVRANNIHDASQLTIMSYNVMFVPRLLVFERDQITRARLLTKAKFIRTSDILCLQEVFQPKPTDILLNSLADTYNYSTPILGDPDDEHIWDEIWNQHIGKSSLKILSGGLIVLSQWPIAYAIEYFFENTCSGHTFVRSGFIYAKIIYGQQRIPIHLIATHLQPSDHRGCFLSTEQQTREKQMNEIVNFLNKKNFTNQELLFITGDLNIDKYNSNQYETMIDILNVEKQILYPSSIHCTWDSSFNAMTTTTTHKQNQLLDYIFIHKDHQLNNSIWYNLITDRLASKQWHSLGRNRLFFDDKNIPIMELSDHYPVVGFFNLSEQEWPERPSGVITYVQIVTADTNLPLVILDRKLYIVNSSDQIASTFILTNNGTPRRHRCLRSEQFIILIDSHQPQYYLSNLKYFRMQFGMKQVQRYLKIIQIDSTTKCINTNSTFILQTQSLTDVSYVNMNENSQLCSCTTQREQAQLFRLIEIKRENISCEINH